jgi:hypothetical protein
MGGATAGVAAAAARARRRVIGHFMSRGAVSADKAVSFTPHWRMETRFFERMCDNGIIVAASDDSWYIDVAKLEVYQRSRRKRMRIVLAGLATALAAGIGIGLLG